MILHDYFQDYVVSNESSPRLIIRMLSITEKHHIISSSMKITITFTIPLKNLQKIEDFVLCDVISFKD
jgi:hypothetical protein